MERIIKTIFPPKCISCGKIGKSLCKKCINKCDFIDIGRCVICQEPAIDGMTHAACSNSPAPESLFCCFEYKGVVRECLRRAKYNSMEFDALKDLTDAGLRHAWRVGIFYSEVVVVPIPLSPKRAKSRGFNQAEVVARKVAEFYKLKTDFSVLRRGKETLPLADLGRSERLKEMSEAFVVDSAKAGGKKFLLIDDVCTTGATLISCARALLTAGATEVDCFTVAAVL